MQVVQYLYSFVAHMVWLDPEVLTSHLITDNATSDSASHSICSAAIRTHLLIVLSRLAHSSSALS